MSERRENGTGLSQEPLSARRRRWHWALLLPLANLVWIVLFLSDYTNVWVAPEAIAWRAELSANRTLGETVRFAFNWSALEGAPRVTRPLSNLFETADNAVRKRLWRSWTPHPALSLTYLFTLIVAPVLLFAVLRALGIRDSLAWCGAALYLCNPGTLSLLAIGFRPGKAMACAATVAVLWWASRLKKVSFVHIVPLYLFLFASLFWDETALVALPALLILFPRVVFSGWPAAVTFCLVPVGYAAAVRWLLPAVHAAAGFALPAKEGYAPLERITGWLSSGSDSEMGAEFRRYVASNARIALMDCLGLINPGLTGSGLYWTVFIAIAACLGVLGVLVAIRFSRLRGEFRKTLHNASIVLRSAGFLAVCLVFHGVLLSSVGQKTWGLYWYGTFIALAFVIALAALLEHLQVPPWFAAVFVLLVSLASFQVFPATNRAYKTFHYYPYSPLLLRAVFKNELNRFAISGPDLSSAQMRRYTQELAQREATESVTDVPAELLYVVYELRLSSSGDGCKHYHPTFSLIRNSEGSHLDCHEPILEDGEVQKFLGVWLAPSTTSIRRNSEFVVLEDGIPKVAAIEGEQVSIAGQGVTGKLSDNGMSLVWSNGRIWERRSGASSGFEGKWWLDGTQVIRKATNRDVLVVLDTRAGLIQPGGTILVPDPGNSGALSPDLRKLLWMDGAVYTRP